MKKSFSDESFNFEDTVDRLIDGFLAVIFMVLIVAISMGGTLAYGL